MHVTIRQLEVFEAVARRLSFTQAAGITSKPTCCFYADQTVRK